MHVYLKAHRKMATDGKSRVHRISRAPKCGRGRERERNSLDFVTVVNSRDLCASFFFRIDPQPLVWIESLQENSHLMKPNGLEGHQYSTVKPGAEAKEGEGPPHVGSFDEPFCLQPFPKEPMNNFYDMLWLVCVLLLHCFLTLLFLLVARSVYTQTGTRWVAGNGMKTGSWVILSL